MTTAKMTISFSRILPDYDLKVPRRMPNTLDPPSRKQFTLIHTSQIAQNNKTIINNHVKFT